MVCANVNESFMQLMENCSSTGCKMLASHLASSWWEEPTMESRGGVEDTRLEAKAKAKDTKKSEAKAKAKDSLSEDRPSRGQGQECSRPRPRTKDTAASVFQKKKVFKKVFQAISNL